ncbi:MAG: FecR family protein [Aestuariibacter sp.]
MNNISNFSTKETIQELACMWVSRIDRGLSESEKDELSDWVAASNQHKEQLFDMASLWDNMSVMHELSGLFPLQSKPELQPRKQSAWHRHPIAIAASFVFFCTLAIAWLLPGQIQQMNEIAVHDSVQMESTGVGEQRTVSLADGSVLHLNTDTLLEVQYSDEKRAIKLRQGEAHFEVAHDATRPFVVSAGSNAVTAVGTAFNVEMYNESDIELLVTEGKVMIQNAQLPSPVEGIVPQENPQALFMISGEKALLSNAEPLEKITLSLDQVQRALSWQQGMLVFEGEPLETALSEVSRYTSVDFDISDEQLKQVRVAGFFKVGDIDGLLHALNNNFEISYQKVTDDHIKLFATHSGS